jgi:hypothetical protein
LNAFGHASAVSINFGALTRFDAHSRCEEFTNLCQANGTNRHRCITAKSAGMLGLWQTADAGARLNGIWRFATKLGTGEVFSLRNYWVAEDGVGDTGLLVGALIRSLA